MSEPQACWAQAGRAACSAKHRAAGARPRPALTAVAGRAAALLARRRRRRGLGRRRAGHLRLARHTRLLAPAQPAVGLFRLIKGWQLLVPAAAVPRRRRRQLSLCLRPAPRVLRRRRRTLCGRLQRQRPGRRSGAVLHDELVLRDLPVPLVRREGRRALAGRAAAVEGHVQLAGQGVQHLSLPPEKLRCGMEGSRAAEAGGGALAGQHRGAGERRQRGWQWAGRARRQTPFGQTSGSSGGSSSSSSTSTSSSSTSGSIRGGDSSRASSRPGSGEAGGAGAHPFGFHAADRAHVHGCLEGIQLIRPRCVPVHAIPRHQRAPPVGKHGSEKPQSAGPGQVGWACCAAGDCGRASGSSTHARTMHAGLPAGMM